MQGAVPVTPNTQAISGAEVNGYEPPRLIPVGSLRDLLGKTALLGDHGAHRGGGKP
jgi:hypothetical protein